MVNCEQLTLKFLNSQYPKISAKLHIKFTVNDERLTPIDGINRSEKN